MTCEKDQIFPSLFPTLGACNAKMAHPVAL